MNSPELQRYTLQFHGKGDEYFRIWLVNIALTVLTLGLYWPWATVRKRRYFYNQTYLDGHAFDFLGQPASIFKGFISIYLLFILYQVAAHLGWMWLAGALGLLGLGLLPWLVQKSLRFRARTLSWRGMKGQFHGKLGDSYFNYLLFPILTVISLYSLFPLWLKRTQDYAMGHVGFGDQRLLNQTKIRDFYLLAWKCLMLILAFACTAAVFGLFIALYFKSGKTLSLWSGGLAFVAIGIGYALLMVGYFSLIISLKAVYNIGLKRLRWHGTQIGELRFEANWSVWGFMKIEIPNMLLIACTFGFYSPVAQIKRMEYMIDNLCLVGPEGALEQWVCTSSQSIEGASGDAGTDLIDLDIGF